MKKPIDAADWKWFGEAAHFICGRWCRFHMATQIGKYLVSTVGKYVPPDLINERGEDAFLAKHPDGEEIGLHRFYETMVFRAGKPCKHKGCGCGMPEIDGSEIDFGAYNTAGDATAGHLAMCQKWSRK